VAVVQGRRGHVDLRVRGHERSGIQEITIVHKPGSYVKVVLYKGTHRLEVVGRIKRLSEEFGVMLEDVVSVKDADGPYMDDDFKIGRRLVFARTFTAAKALFENRWIVEYVTMKPMADEVILGMKL
jgi:hypothetical protein